MNLKSRAVLAGSETDLLDFLIFVAVLLNKLVPEWLHGQPGLLVPAFHPCLDADTNDSKALGLWSVRLPGESLYLPS